MKIRVFFHKNIDDKTRKIVADTITSTFHVEVEQNDMLIDLDESYNRYRNQCNAEKILDMIESEKLFLAVIPFDIYVPGLNFVFGVAKPLKGAIVGTFRLQYGASSQRYAERLAKTVKHELGHVFGLPHCRNKCVMRFANSLYELDIKPSNFCEKCLMVLRSIRFLNSSSKLYK